MFLVKTALLLWAGVYDGTVPLIVFSLLEIIPSMGTLVLFLFAYSRG